MAKIIDSRVLLARDFSSLMEWSIDKIPKITDEWTDMSVTAPEMVFLSVACYSYDILNFALDRKFLDNQIRFSRSMDNLLNMCVLRGVEVSGMYSAITTLNINYNSVGMGLESSITVPKGSIFEVYDSNLNRTFFLNTLDEVVLEHGITPVTCVEGIAKTISIDKTYFSSIGTYVILDEYIGMNTIKVLVDGVEWAKVDDAFLITTNNSSYSVHRYFDNYTLVKLTPGFETAIGNDVVTIQYMLSGGILGNFSKVAEITPKFPLIDNYSKRADGRLSISLVSSEGGINGLDLEATRQLLGTTSSDVSTLVVTQDYVDLVNQVEFVYSCVVKEDSGVKNIYYVADSAILDYGVTYEMLSSSIYDIVIGKVPLFTQVAVNPVLIRPVSVELIVYLTKNLLSKTELESDIKNLICTMFSRQVSSPGTKFLRANISLAIEGLSSSIGHVLFKYPQFDIFCLWNEIINIDRDSIYITFERG